MQRDIRSEVVAYIADAIGSPEEVEVAVPERTELGHYATNIALRRAKKESCAPMELAERIAGKVREQAPEGFFKDISVAKPGFVILTLSAETLRAALAGIASEVEHFGEQLVGAGKTVIVEYSQPNIAKQLHIGHLRTTIIGDALANLYAMLGYRVIRWNYLGDWGTQFGKVIAAYKLWGDPEKVKEHPIDELGKLYVQFHDEAKHDPELEKRGQEEFKKLESGDKENRSLWKQFRAYSLEELEQIYALLGVRFDTYEGESSFEEALPGVIERLTVGKIAHESEGALIVPLEDEGLPPALVRKADGASLYLTRDIAALEYRIEKYHPTKVLYVVGNEQALHFEQLFAVAPKLGIAGAELVHVKYGLVLGEDAKKLATREGRVIVLREVLEKAIRLARETVEAKSPDLSEKEKDQIARAVGIGALKYFDLKEGRTSDIVFDWDRMLDLRGMSAPYLQYTHARLQSIVRKVGRTEKSDYSRIGEPAEYALIAHLLEFPQAIRDSADRYATSVLALYLYQLAEKANTLYEQVQIASDADESRKAARCSLISTTCAVLARGLGILGIEAPDRL